ncbi:hypothetical protein ZIOFF_018777 [Zingiber officinale]|uniref:non-specific serine/threonine protein kinase n=1 Tax=Zingiber officinale TaxID=94328 RepID=A0A8J5LB78_ZINOF|nr:hypothetical protein ZIOFF_018777 [Zingiber officinale]
MDRIPELKMASSQNSFILKVSGVHANLLESEVNGTMVDQNESMPEVDSIEGGRSSFNGASHPLEPVDTDLVKLVYVAIGQEKSDAGCLLKGISTKGPLPPDKSFPIELNESDSLSSSFATPRVGNVSPHSSIDSNGVVTAMSIVKLVRETESLESIKTSISRASDSSGISDDSCWSFITGSVNKPHMGNDPRWKAILTVRSRDGILGMSQFQLLKRVGCGDIGSVYLSELSGTRCYFAMKILCLVMEFCPGGDLHTLRHRQPGKHFSEYAVRFYAAEVLPALEYLHMLGVVYRDLKPENVFVRDDGHIVLSDFDLSSSLNSDPSKPCMLRAKTLSPIEQEKDKKTMGRDTKAAAPEIIKGEEHGSAVDWWIFGIFLQELLSGKTPFKGSSNIASLFNVVGRQLRLFPETPSAEIKQHPFFDGVNWALIQCSTSPEVPRPVEPELLLKFRATNGFGTSGKRICSSRCEAWRQVFGL